MYDIIVAGNINLETHLRIGAFPIGYRKARFTPHGVSDNPSGVGLNISAALAALGHRPCLAAVLGQDAVGDFVEAQLRALPIGRDGLVRCLEHSMRSIILSDAQGQGAMFLERKEIGEFEYPVQRFQRLLEQAPLVYIARSFWTAPLGQLAREAGKQVVTDLQDLNLLDAYQAQFAEVADIVFFSAEHLIGEVENCIRRLWDEFDVEIVVCGQGSAGATLGVRERNLIRAVPSVALRPVICTTGAGDAMVASFLSGLLCNYQPLEALIRAQVFTGHHVGELGASQGFLNREALDRYFREFIEPACAGNL